MPSLQRAPSAARLLAGAAVAAVLALAVALVVVPTTHRHALAAGRAAIAPDDFAIRKPEQPQIAVTSTPAVAPATPVAADDVAIDFPLRSPIVAAAHSDHGTYLAAADGGVFALSHAAPFVGSMSGRGMAQPVVGIALDPTSAGYWLVGADGGVFAFGAAFYGPANVPPPTSPIVGIAPTPTGHGYWVAGSDGGVFAYGDAPYLGAMSSRPLTHPIVAITATPSGHGYWLVASDGGIFSFGDAPFLGAPSEQQLMAPVVGMVSSASGRGYLLAAADGGVFAYGDAPWLGSAPNVGRGTVVGISLVPNSYRLSTDRGAELAPGDKPVPGAIDALDPAPAGSRVPPAEPSRSQARTATPAAPAAPAAAVPAGSDIVAAINTARRANGLAPMRADSRLASLASSWSGSMSQSGALQHQNLAGLLQQSSWSTTYSTLAENIYEGSGGVSATTVVAAWMGSPGHRANILSTALNSVGAGAQAGRGAVWATADFGTAG